jgi:hypothetical protein
MDPLTMMMIAQQLKQRMEQHQAQMPQAGSIPSIGGVAQGTPLVPAPMSTGQRIGQGAMQGAMGGMITGRSPFFGAMMGAAMPAGQAGIEHLKNKRGLNTGSLFTDDMMGGLG